MDLKKKHRSAIVILLREANDEVETCEFNLSISNDDDVKSFQVDQWFAKEKVKILEKALVSNQIDF